MLNLVEITVGIDSFFNNILSVLISTHVMLITVYSMRQWKKAPVTTCLRDVFGIIEVNPIFIPLPQRLSLHILLNQAVAFICLPVKQLPKW